jgi:small ligand-binding sensory domain FIST
MVAAAISHLHEGVYDEKRVRDVARTLRGQLPGAPVLGLVFVTPDYIPHISDFLETLRLNAHIATLVGCTSTSIIGSAEEQENRSGFSLLLLHFPNSSATAVPIHQDLLQNISMPAEWHKHAQLPAGPVKAWLTLIDPFSMPVEPWLKSWNAAYPKTPCFGGLASSEGAESWVFLNDRLIEGGVAVALQGAIKVHAVVSQGCKPIGEPLTVTQANENVLLTLGSQPAYQVLNNVYLALSDEEKSRAKGHLFAGLAMSEYVDDYKRGDFLVRNILGADPNTGAVAIGAPLRVGQTLQYQLRDAVAASEDFKALLHSLSDKIKKAPAVAGLLCTCNGRGSHLFQKPNHDAEMIARFFPGLPVSGFFANGEIGPVGETNFAHGYTASLAIFSGE